jgi:hypothetical protein
MQEYRQTHKAETTPTESEIAIVTAHFDTRHRERIKGHESELLGNLKTVEEELAGTGLTEAKRQELENGRLTLQAKLKPPGRNFALFVLRSWKLQRHLYEKYGGGRVLWQQAGLEAFDAMHQWLESQEKNGKFKISDSKLRPVFYEYWTTLNHGAFLTDDDEHIRREFLEPEWLKEPPSTKPTSSSQTTSEEREYEDVLRFIDVPTTALPKHVRLVERIRTAPVIPATTNPDVIVDPQQIGPVAAFFGICDESELGPVRAAVVAIYQDKDPANEIGVYGIYFSDKKTADKRIKKLAKAKEDSPFILHGRLLLYIWKDDGVSDSAVKAIRDYFGKARFKSERS